MAKAQKIEKTEEFIISWEEENSLWDVCATVYRDRNERKKSVEILAGKHIFSHS